MGFNFTDVAIRNKDHKVYARIACGSGHGEMIPAAPFSVRTATYGDRVGSRLGLKSDRISEGTQRKRRFGALISPLLYQTSG